MRGRLTSSLAVSVGFRKSGAAKGGSVENYVELILLSRDSARGKYSQWAD